LADLSLLFPRWLPNGLGFAVFSRYWGVWCVQKVFCCGFFCLADVKMFY
jgi:hypothetical protein